MWIKRSPCLWLMATVVLAGCGSNPARTIGPSVEEIYSNTSRGAARDTVQMVRQGLQSNARAGTSDPSIPIRQPETVLPIWIPPYVDKATGRRIDGHWQHAVMQESGWQLGY